MGLRLKSALSRAKYAAVGAALGAAVGGLISRNAASTGGALGGLAGATLADVRSDPEGLLAALRSDGDGGDLEIEDVESADVAATE